MGVSKDRLSQIRSGITSVGWWRDRVFVPYVVGTLTQLHPNYPNYGDAINVMKEDWDNLIILDACRADIFEEVIATSTFSDYRREISVGSHSSEWTSRTFKGETFDDTVYVSANPHTSLVANNVFHELIEVWKDFEIAPNEIDPTKIANAGIQAHKRNPNKRLIIHFMQPHGTGGLVSNDLEPIDRYRQSISKVMDIVFDLSDNLGGKTVISADHGELFTEGIRAKLGITQHRARLRIPELVTVPWAILEGSRREISTGEVTSRETTPNEIEAQLRNLGYK